MGSIYEYNSFLNKDVLLEEKFLPQFCNDTDGKDYEEFLTNNIEDAIMLPCSMCSSEQEQSWEDFFSYGNEHCNKCPLDSKRKWLLKLAKDFKLTVGVKTKTEVEAIQILVLEDVFMKDKAIVNKNMSELTKVTFKDGMYILELGLPFISTVRTDFLFKFENNLNELVKYIKDTLTGFNSKVVIL